MRVKLKENYSNPFFTTTKGNSVGHDEWVNFDESDKEMDLALRQGFFVVEQEESQEQKGQEKEVEEEVEEEKIGKDWRENDS